MEQQDIFIAYHGTYADNGSLAKAKELFYYFRFAIDMTCVQTHFYLRLKTYGFLPSDYILLVFSVFIARRM